MGSRSLGWRAKAGLPLCHAWRQKHRCGILEGSGLWEDKVLLGRGGGIGDAHCERRLGVERSRQKPEVTCLCDFGHRLPSGT